MTAVTTLGAPVRYSRKLSQIERGYLTAAASGTDQLIQTVVEGDGPLDPAEVADAVAVATAANPGMAVARRGPVWRSGGPVPPVVELPDWDLDHDELHRDIDVVTGPIAEIHLIPGDTQRLLVRASHIATDGRGLQHWMADVFRVLRGEEPVGAPDTVNDTHFRAVAGSVAGDAAPVAQARFPAVLGHGPSGDRPLWTRRLVRAQPSAVTARIAAAISRHVGADGDTGGGRVAVPVDLRRHDRTIRSTANLTAQLLQDITRDDDWRRLHGRLLRALMRKQEVAALRRDFVRTNPFANSLDAAQEHDDTTFACTAIISDHGPVDLDRFRTARFTPRRMYTLPMLVPYAEMFVSSCQTPDGTELTLSCRRRAGAAAAAEAILDDVQRLLED